MSDYISRQAAIDTISNYYFDFPKYMERFVVELRDAMKQDLISDINDVPSADVRESTHGKWLNFAGMCYKCNQCGYKVGSQVNFCPNCGAYMGGERE